MNLYNSTFKRKPSTKAKTRTCKNRACRRKFTPTETHPFAIACCTGCEIILAKRHIEKAQEARQRAERKELKARKQAIKGIGELKTEAQRAFNDFIRYRDRSKPCICCNKPFEPQKLGGSMDAGHYLSRGSSDHLRFDERNVHGQRKNCNRPGGTTRAAFRAGMEARIGLEALEALEADKTLVKWTREDLIAIKAKYRAKLKELIKESE